MISWAFVPIDHMNVRTKFEVHSFTRSWDNIYIQLLFTVYTVDKTQISVQLQQNTKAIYSTSINEQFETNLS